MSDPHEDAAAAWNSAQETLWADMIGAVNAASEDAKATGTGFVRITWPGPVYERLPPSRVLFMPDDPEIPE